jgi:hypothetical protein
MTRAATSVLLIFALILYAGLSLPGIAPAAISIQAPGCHCCCEGTVPAATPCHGCQPDMPGPCGASGPGGMFACGCSAGSLACLNPAPAANPTWQVSSHYPALASALVQLFPPNIFHPPELLHPFTSV